jgi:hypothetical protein
MRVTLLSNCTRIPLCTQIKEFILTRPRTTPRLNSDRISTFTVSGITRTSSLHRQIYLSALWCHNRHQHTLQKWVQHYPLPWWRDPLPIVQPNKQSNHSLTLKSKRRKKHLSWAYGWQLGFLPQWPLYVNVIFLQDMFTHFSLACGLHSGMASGLHRRLDLIRKY